MGDWISSRNVVSNRTLSYYLASKLVYGQWVFLFFAVNILKKMSSLSDILFFLYEKKVRGRIDNNEP